MLVNISGQSRGIGASVPAAAPAGDETPLSIAITTAGRVGFYIDYSELSATGTHTFYVCRTHGTAGAVAVDYATSGDTHTTASGTLNWADGEANIKTFTATVSSKSAGDHRIVATLSSPTGGLTLHHGTNTVAYGVIDDGTISSDAIFYDSAAAGGGDGTQSTPYNNLYTAIGALSSERYLYLKGSFTPDNTNTANPNGGGGIVDCVFWPTGRAGESTRLIIRNWPGSTFTYTGGASTNKDGFYSSGGKNYITFRGLAFSSIDSSGQTNAEAFGVGCMGTGATDITVEKCTFDDINGSTNTAGIKLYSSSNCKAWRCTANNIQVNGSNTNGNSGGVWLSYSATTASVQRCTVTNAHIGVYFKRPGTVDGSVRFCDTETEVGVQFGFGSATAECNYAIVQSNLIKDGVGEAAIYINNRDTSATGRQWVCQNVIENFRPSTGDVRAINTINAVDAIIFNNIFDDCRGVWGAFNTTTDAVLYANYNHDFGTTLNRHKINGTNYADIAAVNVLNWELNSVEDTDPKFTNPATNDFTLQVGSPALTGGVGSSEQGIYFTGDEVVGASL